MSNELRSALVVLAAPLKPDLVRSWFSEQGFDVDPVVGISFSISGPGALFDKVLGGTGTELDQAALAGRVDRAVLPYVAAVVLGTELDFGPGNP